MYFRQITLARLVLVTTRDYARRLHLGKGNYGKITLRYVGGALGR